MPEFFELKFVESFKKIKGIIHVGAHYGEEANEYNRVTKNVVWFEAHPEYAAKLRDHLSMNFPHQKYFEACLSDEAGEVDFWITKDEFASSLLKPEYHQIQNPHAPIVDKITVQTHTFADFWPTTDLQLSDYNFLILDTQGSEMKVLRGIGNHLDQFDIVQAEYSTVEFYEGGAQLDEIREYLSDFKMVYPERTPLIHADALFIRR